MARKLYSLTPEHRAQLKGWAARWIANAMSVKAMDETERAICRRAIVDLYAAAALAPPKHIVFVPSPFVLSFAGGFAASIWWRSKNAATDAATDAATRVATRVATRAATDAALKNWYFINGDLVALAYDLGIGISGLRCAAQAWCMWSGGNQYSSLDSYLSFFQDIVQLKIDYTKYAPWRALAEHSGPRIVHPDFCIISDRPELLLVDERDQPHNDTGPFCRWRDGSALYAIHGTRVPGWIVEYPDRITPDVIDAETNAEVRRVMIERYGMGRGDETVGAGAYIRDAGAKRLDHHEQFGTLWRRNIPGDEALVMLEVVNRSPEPDGHFKHYFLRVPPTMADAHEAAAWTFGETKKTYRPAVET